MYLVIALGIIGFWLFVSFFLAWYLGKSFKFPEPVIVMLCWSIFLLPIVPEVTGSLLFKYECSKLEPAKHFIPSGSDATVLFKADGSNAWKGYAEWKNISRAYLLGEGDEKASETVLTSFPFKIIKRNFIYEQSTSKKKIREFVKLSSEGSFLNKFFGHWVQYQCFSP